MGSSFTPERIRLLREAAANSNGAARATTISGFPPSPACAFRSITNQVTSYRERGAKAGWIAEGVLKLSCLTLNPSKSLYKASFRMDT